MSASEYDDPATVVFTWDVAPGREAEFESWAHGVNETATAFPGHRGATWLRAEGSRHRYYTILNFADEDRLDAWMHSDERERWLALPRPPHPPARPAHGPVGQQAIGPSRTSWW